MLVASLIVPPHAQGYTGESADEAFREVMSIVNGWQHDDRVSVEPTGSVPVITSRERTVDDLRMELYGRYDGTSFDIQRVHGLRKMILAWLDGSNYAKMLPSGDMTDLIFGLVEYNLRAQQLDDLLELLDREDVRADWITGDSVHWYNVEEIPAKYWGVSGPPGELSQTNVLSGYSLGPLRDTAPENYISSPKIWQPYNFEPLIADHELITHWQSYGPRPDGTENYYLVPFSPIEASLIQTLLYGNGGYIAWKYVSGTPEHRYMETAPSNPGVTHTAAYTSARWSGGSFDLACAICGENFEREGDNAQWRRFVLNFYQRYYHGRSLPLGAWEPSYKVGYMNDAGVIGNERQRDAFEREVIDHLISHPDLDLTRTYDGRIERLLATPIKGGRDGIAVAGAEVLDNGLRTGPGGTRMIGDYPVTSGFYESLGKVAYDYQLTDPDDISNRVNADPGSPAASAYDRYVRPAINRINQRFPFSVIAEVNDLRSLLADRPIVAVGEVDLPILGSVDVFAPAAAMQPHRSLMRVVVLLGFIGPYVSLFSRTVGWTTTRYPAEGDSDG